MERPETWRLYLSTDDATEAVADVEDFIRQLDRLPDDPRAWKWAAVMLDSALRGLLVVALKGGGGLGAMPDRYAAKYLEAERRGKLLRHRVAPLPTLLDRVGDVDSLPRLSCAQPVTLSADEKKAAKYVHDQVRNFAMHQPPGGWLAYLPGLCSSAALVLDVMRRVAFDTVTYPWDADTHARLEDLLLVADHRVEALRGFYRAEASRFAPAEATILETRRPDTDE